MSQTVISLSNLGQSFVLATPPVLDHHRAVLAAMEELPQPFKAEDCAPFYGITAIRSRNRREAPDLRVDPLIHKVITALLASGLLREDGKGLYQVGANRPDGES